MKQITVEIDDTVYKLLRTLSERPAVPMPPCAFGWNGCARMST